MYPLIPQEGSMNLKDIIGVNTHIDFAYAGSPYLDIAKTIAAIKYLGVIHLRDAAGKIDTAKKWVAVRNATHAKFCAFLPNGSPAYVEQAFGFWPELYRDGLIDIFEAPNEPDKPYSIGLGNSIDLAVKLTQSKVAPFVKTLPPKHLINISVGAGWKPPLWEGNYGLIPNMTKWCDYANAHTYPNVGADVSGSIARLNELALKSMPGKPVIITELGWDLKQGHTQDQIASDIVKAAHSGLAERIYIYALFDDQSGNFGLFNNDGTPRPAATAIRNALTPT